jgi:hypothetical protein
MKAALSISFSVLPVIDKYMFIFECCITLNKETWYTK